MHTQSSNLHFARKDRDGPPPRRNRRCGRQRGLPRGQQRGSGGGRGAKVDDGSGGGGAFLPSPLSQPNLNSRCESVVGRGVLSYMRVSERATLNGAIVGRGVPPSPALFPSRSALNRRSDVRTTGIAGTGSLCLAASGGPTHIRGSLVTLPEMPSSRVENEYPLSSSDIPFTRYLFFCATFLAFRLPQQHKEGFDAKTLTTSGRAGII